ncbi:MAG: Holliday junction branch migration protein RuvA [Beijerinckiaceae bacterium]|nr:Holliday junction branch migration protein RuvA [Beijerinckiaceae bacterium]
MIGKLRGVVDSYSEDYLILDVHGVGYVVQCSSRTLQALPRPGEATVLAIETHVREDAIRLYGFLSDEERDWFRLLQTVQGVGAKVALAILGLGPIDALASAIVLQNKPAISRAPGVGPRLAARITAELKDKVPAGGSGDMAMAGGLATDDPLPGAPPAIQDAISALVNLGYGRPQASLAVAAAQRALGESAETQALIRRGLKELANA